SFAVEAGGLEGLTDAFHELLDGDVPLHHVLAGHFFVPAAVKQGEEDRDDILHAGFAHHGVNLGEALDAKLLFNLSDGPEGKAELKLFTPGTFDFDFPSLTVCSFGHWSILLE